MAGDGLVLPALTDRVEVWRLTTISGRPTLTRYRVEVAALMVDASERDGKPGFARNSDTIILMPSDTDIGSEDEVRFGRRRDRSGNIVQRRLVVDGVSRYTGFGHRHLEAWCRETT